MAFRGAIATPDKPLQCEYCNARVASARALGPVIFAWRLPVRPIKEESCIRFTRPHAAWKAEIDETIFPLIVVRCLRVDE